MDRDDANHLTAVNLDRLMRRFGSGLHERSRAIDIDRLGPNGGMTLVTLSDIEPVATKDLVAHMCRDKSQMTKTLRQLEALGLVQRSPSSKDGRVMIVSLTEEGRQRVQRIRLTMSEVVNELLAPLSERERAQLAEILKRVQLNG